MPYQPNINCCVWFRKSGGGGVGRDSQGQENGEGEGGNLLFSLCLHFWGGDVVWGGEGGGARKFSAPSHTWWGEESLSSLDMASTGSPLYCTLRGVHWKSFTPMELYFHWFPTWDTFTFTKDNYKILEITFWGRLYTQNFDTFIYS